jgi:predicted DCC family thiol-disulfide oxidoreductase YuxK
MLNKPILLYDGYCNLCSWLVRFVKKHDKKGTIGLLPLHKVDSITHITINSEALPNNTVVFIDLQGVVFQKSRAVLRIFKSLGGFWLVLWALLIVIPNPLRDLIYNFIARNRYKWFGQRDSCYLPD